MWECVCYGGQRADQRMSAVRQVMKGSNGVHCILKGQRSRQNMQHKLLEQLVVSQGPEPVYRVSPPAQQKRERSGQRPAANLSTDNSVKNIAEEKTVIQ